MITKVQRSRTFERQFQKAPVHIRQKVKLWIFELAVKGLREARKRPGYHDEPLRGARKGQRSLRLSKGYRLIYVELEKGVLIELLEVNKHDY